VKGTRFSSWVGNSSTEEQEPELTSFVRMVKRKIQCGEEESWIEDIVDPRLEGKFSRRQAATMVEIGISCVEEDRSKRPEMASVLQLLLECEDDAKLHFPKQHFQQASTETPESQNALNNTAFLT